ncbi:MAG: hypothetical protein ACP5RC_12745, partial [Halothiobacillaceae bacterium]
MLSGRMRPSPYHRPSLIQPHQAASVLARSIQRTASTYIFGAICPRLGKGAGLVLPVCNVATM